MLEYDKALLPCPICKAPAFVAHDIVDGFEFGWSVGCARACINDKVHNLGADDFKKARLVLFGLGNKDLAIKAWNNRCKEEG